MAIYVNTIPQQLYKINVITLRQIIDVLPEKLDYDINIWIGGKLAKYGKTTENLIFISDLEGDYVPSEIMQYFNSFVKPFGFQATVSNNWKGSDLSVLKLYNDGRLIIDKKTMTYKELPSVLEKDYSITYEEVLSKLPDEIEWKNTIYLTGGIVKNGFSCNDVDILVFDIERKTLTEIRNYFKQKINCKVDVGSFVMTEREPVYLYKIYEGGKLCQ